MTFLFEKHVALGTETGDFKIFQTVENSFFAESTQTGGIAGFHFHRMKDEWVSDDPDKQQVAEDLGKLIDNFQTDQTF